mgnify:CR=1 FL=1
MTLTVKEYKEDLNYFFDKFFEVHVEPDFRVPMEELEKQKEYCLSMVESCSSIEEFHKIGQQFLNIVGDGHTSLESPENDDIVKAPLILELVDGAIVVKEKLEVDTPLDLSKVSIGDVLLFIDDQEVERRLNHILKLTSYNNHDWGKKWALKKLFRYSKGEKTSVELVLADNEGKIYSARIPLLNNATSDYYTEIRRKKWTRPVEVDYLEDIKTGYLRYRACKDKWHFEQAYDMYSDRLEDMGVELEEIPDMEEVCWDFFKEMANRDYDNLIIDIRGNGGGDSRVATVLYKYLTTKKIKSYGGKNKVSLPVKETPPYADFFADHEIGVIEEEFAYHEYPYTSRLTEEQLSSLNQFNGQVYILVDNRVFSSGEYMVAELKANDFGTLIGEPTGGGGTVPGNIMHITLPNTGLEFGISISMFEDPTDNDLPAILPDYLIRQTLGDFQKGKDTVLDYVKKMIADS